MNGNLYNIYDTVECRIVKENLTNREVREYFNNPCMKVTGYTSKKAKYKGRYLINISQADVYIPEGWIVDWMRDFNEIAEKFRQLSVEQLRKIRITVKKVEQ